MIGIAFERQPHRIGFDEDRFIDLKAELKFSDFLCRQMIGLRPADLVGYNDCDISTLKQRMQIH